MFRLFVALRIDAAITVALEFDAAVTVGLEIDAVVTATALDCGRHSRAGDHHGRAGD